MFRRSFLSAESGKLVRVKGKMNGWIQIQGNLWRKVEVHLLNKTINLSGLPKLCWSGSKTKKLKAPDFNPVTNLWQNFLREFLFTSSLTKDSAMLQRRMAKTVRNQICKNDWGVILAAVTAAKSDCLREANSKLSSSYRLLGDDVNILH